MGLTTYSFNQMLFFLENYLAMISLHVREFTLQSGIRPPRCWRCVPAAIYFTDESSDGSDRGLDGLDCSTKLVDRGSSPHRGPFQQMMGSQDPHLDDHNRLYLFNYSFVVCSAMASCCIVFRRLYLNHITVVVCTLQFCSICRRRILVWLFSFFSEQRTVLIYRGQWTSYMFRI